MFAKSSPSIRLHLVRIQTVATDTASYLIELLFISDENTMSSLNGPFGSLADISPHISRMSAFGGKADVSLLANQRRHLEVSLAQLTDEGRCLISGERH